MSETQNPSSRPWTDRQKDAFSTVGKSLLVSAAAGAGKTAVLAQRCVHLVCDANPPCDVARLLVVTFTDSAAAEMKTRIKAALRRRFEENPSDRLQRQADLVEHARISTVHSFCANVLRQNFHLVGLDPNFRILDGDDAHLIRTETAADLLERRYESDETGDFSRLVDAFGQGDDGHLSEKIIHTHQLLCSLSNPEDWKARTLADIRQAADVPLAQSRLGRQLLALIEQTLADLSRQSSDSAASIRSRGNALQAYADQLDELRAAFEHWKTVFHSEGLDMLISEFRDFEIPKAPRVSESIDGKAGAKALLDAVKDEIREGSLRSLLMFDSESWRAGMAEVLPHAQAFLSLVTDFETDYAAAKTEQRALDFSDLERFTLRVLGTWTGSGWKPTAVARAFHDQFQHVLVDEYQDINDIQDAILSLVSRECLADRKVPGNLFCVGDVKQSIFRFRLSDPQRFLSRQAVFSKPGAAGEVIYLPDNFRSRAPLLEAINFVFEKLMTRRAVEIEYDQSQRLQARGNFPTLPATNCFPGAPIELHILKEGARSGDGQDESDTGDTGAELTRAHYEAFLLAKRIREMRGLDGKPRMSVMRADGSGKQTPQPIEFGDIVILLRAMKFKADYFAEVLRAAGIPVHSDGGGGFFESAEIRDMLSLLRVLDNQRQDIPLAAFLRSPLADVPQPDECLARIHLAYRDEAEEIPFHQAVYRYAQEQNDEWAAHLRWLFARLEDWRDQANKRPAADLIWSIYQETGYLAYVSGLEDGRQRVANLLDLHDRAAQFSHFLRQGLGRFLRFLESLRQEQDPQRPSPAADAQNVVRIMSIHRAKGLEFPVVFLPDLGKAHNLKDAQGAILADRAAGLGMQVVDERRFIRHDSVSSTLVSHSLHRQTIAEELRLLYVAMTRAKEHLVCVGTCRATALEEWENLWRHHTGALPADVVLGARGPIFWLGPIWRMSGQSQSPVFDVTTIEPEEWQTWKHPSRTKAGFDEGQKSMAKLEPLASTPSPNGLADQVIGRFSKSYAHAAMTVVPAAQSVSTRAKRNGNVLADGLSLTHPAEIIGGQGRGNKSAALLEGEGPEERLLRKLDLPSFFEAVAAPKPTDIGTATHRFLELCDFSAASEAGIAAQIKDLVARKFLSPAQAALIDRPALAWFFSTDLAKELARRQSDVIREIPFAMGYSSDPAADAADQTMIRGRIDLLIRQAGGKVAIVDYKTDRLTPDDVRQRMETYKGQMEHYRAAMETIAGAKVAAIHLVFLSPRVIAEL